MSDLVGTRMSGGPPIPQPMTPVIEVYIGGLRISHMAGKPYRIESLDHTSLLGAASMAHITLFDPDWEALESHILERTRIAREGGGPQVFYRFGYAGHGSGVIWNKINGVEGAFYAGQVVQYTPTLSSYGMHIDMEVIGTTSVNMGGLSVTSTPHIGGLPPKEAIERIAEFNGWELDAVWNRDPNAEPEELPSIEENMASSEAENRRAYIQGGSDDIRTIEAMLQSLRPKHPAYNHYEVHLESYIPPFSGGAFDSSGNITTQPKIRLVIECVGRPGTNVIRNWTHVANAKTDIISWSPQILGIPIVAAGGAGLMMRVTDLRTRQHEHQQYTEELSRLRWFPRDEGGYMGIEDAPGGSQYTPKDVGTLEGIRTQPDQRRPAYVVKGDRPYAEAPFTGPRVIADRNAVNYFLQAYQKLCFFSDLTIIGDPWITTLGDNVSVNVLLPMRDRSGTLLHYSSGLWKILGVRHTISGGSYQTQLNLARAGVFAGATGDQTNAAVEG